MKIRFIKLFLVISFLAFSGLAIASDQDEATKAAKEILTSLQQMQLEKLWTTQMSEFYKSKMTKDSFLANLTLGRQQFGSPGESKFIDMAYSQTDPSTGTKGEIYAFNFLTSYAIGKFYERIVVMKDKDGKFRLAGLWGAPAPK